MRPHARALTVAVFAATALACPASAFAQDAGPQLLRPDEVPPVPIDRALPAGPDTVRSKDGSVISGTIVVERSGLYVSVRLADGTDVVIRWDDIEKIERGEALPVPLPAPLPAPPPVKVTPATPPPRAPKPAARPPSDAMPEVHIKGSQQLVLEQLDERAWREVCRAPCDLRLPSDRRYRISGLRVRTSRPFTLAPTDGRAVLDVEAASEGASSGGVGLIVVGSILVPIGLLVALGGSTTASYAGVVMSLTGLVGIIAGGVMLGGAAHTEVRQPLGGSAASVRMPTWNATLERPPPSGMSFALPVLAGTF
jgi:hypothetical protein